MDIIEDIEYECGHKDAPREPDYCPYESEINDRAFPCLCCKECRQNCLDDI